MYYYLIFLMLMSIIGIIVTIKNRNKYIENFEKTIITQNSLDNLKKIYNYDTNTYNFNNLGPTKNISYDNKKIEKIPRKIIIMWNSLDIPEGWSICDGNNDTPDLRNSFIIGSDNIHNINLKTGESLYNMKPIDIPFHTSEIIKTSENYSKKKSEVKSFNILPNHHILIFIMKN